MTAVACVCCFIGAHFSDILLLVKPLWPQFGIWVGTNQTWHVHVAGVKSMFSIWSSFDARLWSPDTTECFDVKMMEKSMFVTFVVEAVAETNKSRVETLDWLGLQECRSPNCRSPTLMSVPVCVCVYVPSSLCACVSVPVCVCECMCLPLCVLCVCECGIFVCASVCVCVSLLSVSVGFSNFVFMFVYFCLESDIALLSPFCWSSDIALLSPMSLILLTRE